ncbi:MAG TPA: HAMP domain-containing sensor histidine kinase [Chloroflexota bacterium]|nr:HAMP domain-containing sensor histidine kinase [Chloroflexota bacterium]
MRQSAPVEVELTQRIHWLIQLRWLAATTVLYGTFLATTVAGIRLAPLPLYLIGAAIAMYNALFIIGLKWTEEASKALRLDHAKGMAHGQIVTDLVFLTLLIHFTGGVENPLSFYFIFHVIIASILLSRWETFVQSTVAIFLFGALVLGEYAGAIPHITLFGPVRPDLATDGQFVAVALLVFSSTIYLSAYMATSIVKRLRERDQEILQLTQELQQKARELEVAYNHLAELEQLKSLHMGRMSQEMKAPLTAIQSSLKGVLEGLTGEVSATQREMVSRAETRTRALLDLVTDLLILSRAREAKLLTDRRAVSPREIVEKVTGIENSRALSKDVTLSAQFSEDVPTMYADPETIKQLVHNLVANAVTYTLSGGRVELKVDSIGEAIRFRISDSGIGIPAAEIPRIFNEFYRAENARRYSDEGTGLGLSIVRSTVDARGGDIKVESQVGTGTTFTVILPVGKAPDDEGEGAVEGNQSETRTLP